MAQSVSAAVSGCPGARRDPLVLDGRGGGQQRPVPPSLNVGDRVSWNTEQGRTRGRIVDRKTKDFKLAGHQFRATTEDPKYVVESEKSGKRAAHAASALRKLAG